MDTKQKMILENVEAHRQKIYDAERWIWKHPQVGYTEWEANAYLIEKFEEVGYELVRADQDPNYGKIPGFYTDIDTGRPGPKVCIMGELDALDIPDHPESVNGMTHSCGHNAQAAGILGIALALADRRILDDLAGSIRLMMVPAEEMIQLPFREELRKQGIIKYLGGKVEFMHRGYFNDVDLALMVHTGVREGKLFSCAGGSNGCMAKTFRYKGKSSHAGGSPHTGINAEYAAILGLQACNDLRETLQEKDYIRFHPVMRGVTSAVNIIPDSVVVESYVRGRTLEAIIRENEKFNRALTGAALSMGAGLELSDRPGYAPGVYDTAFMKLAEKCCVELAGKEAVDFDYDRWGTGSSDFSDLTMVMPGVQPNVAGASGTGHGIDYQISDPEKACVKSAEVQLLIARELLKDDAEAAKKIIGDFVPPFQSIPEYLAYIDRMVMDKDAVTYDEKGHPTVDYWND